MIITGHGRCEHITPVLKALHWLPVQQRIKFKTLVLVYKAVNNLAPVYLQELLHPHVPCRGLRSSEMNLLVVPFTRSSVIQQCVFSAAGPRLWNSLPLSLRSAPILSVFQSLAVTSTSVSQKRPSRIVMSSIPDIHLTGVDPLVL